MPIVSKKQGPRKYQEFTLPSQGYPYNGTIPGGKIKVHAFNFEVEETLGAKGDGQEKLNKIIPMICDLPEGFTVGKLLAADQFFIFLAARSMSFGETYNLSSTCPACGNIEKTDFALPHGLPINTMQPDFDGIVKLTLPESQDDIEIKFLTVADLKEVSTMAKAMNLDPTDKENPQAYRYTLASHIVSVNGGTDFNLQEAVEYLSSLDGRDPHVFKDTIDKNQPGVASLIDMQCPECGEQYQMQFKMTQKFFRP